MTVHEARELIKSLVKKWQHIATTYCWKLDIYYHGQAREMPSGQEKVAGFSHGSYHYLRGGIHFNLELMADLEKEEIEEYVVHEFCHFLLFPMKGGSADKDTELCVTMIARTLLDVQCQDPKAHKKK